MNRGELACNWALGLSALGWAVRGIAAAPPDSRWSVVTLTLCALNGLVGVLFLLRAPLRVASGPWQLAAAVPSFLLGGLLLKLAPHHPWPMFAQALFAAGGLLAFVSLACLGRSFAILPGVREVVVRGPYRFVRHPAYAGECLLVAAACAAGPTLLTISLTCLAVLFVVLRILAEEQVLLTDSTYKAFAETHRWRLVPWVW